MTDSTSTEAPIMLRVDITRDELKELKRQALELDMTVQALAAKYLREGMLS